MRFLVYTKKHDITATYCTCSACSAHRLNSSSALNGLKSPSTSRMLWSWILRSLNLPWGAALMEQGEAVAVTAVMSLQSPRHIWSVATSTSQTCAVLACISDFAHRPSPLSLSVWNPARLTLLADHLKSHWNLCKFKVLYWWSTK